VASDTVSVALPAAEAGIAIIATKSTSNTKHKIFLFIVTFLSRQQSM
jgi:hypothetical protein